MAAASASIMTATLLLALVLLSSQSINFFCTGFQTASLSAATANASSKYYQDRTLSPSCHMQIVSSPSLLAYSSRQSCVQLHMSSNGDKEDITPDDNNNEPSPSSSSPTGGSTTTVKMFELEDAFEDDGENVVGTKFFGGGAQKDELYIPEDEERALELQNVDKEIEYKRFEDGNAFGDGFARRVGEGLQAAINKILYDEDVGGDGGGDSGSTSAWKEDPSLTWETPFGSGKKSSPLMDLASSKSFYNKLDVAILSATTIQSEGKNVNTVEVRWDIGAVWPNPWESRVLLTGTSILTIREDKEENSLVLLKQVDKLDGKNPSDVVGSLSSQLPPRFWDVYHIGMTPSSEKDPRFDAPLLSSSTKSLSTTTNNKGKKGLLSGYKLSYLPPRLVTEPSLIDTNGRDGRTAQALPNHGFTTAVKTMGPNKEEFVPVSPIEIGIVKAEGTESGSLIKWSVPVPPEFASKAVLPLPVMEDEVADDEDEKEEEEEIEVSANRKKFSSPYTASRTNKPPPSPPQSLGCSYSLRPTRFVATLPYAGNPQDEEVTQLRRQLYQDVVEKDGYTPKLDPETGRPVFFFWMNDAKACFTRKGGLGMAVYEWRAEWSKSNEVGIELEC